MDLPVNRMLDISMAVLAGVALGLIFVGGLWLTVRRTSQLRLAVFAVSFLVRSAVLLVGLWWIGHGDPTRMLACGAAAIAVRTLAIRVCAGSTPGTVSHNADEGKSC